jgi:hypothetical protein
VVGVVVVVVGWTIHFEEELLELAAHWGTYNIEYS